MDMNSYCHLIMTEPVSTDVAFKIQSLSWNYESPEMVQ